MLTKYKTDFKFWITIKFDNKDSTKLFNFSYNFKKGQFSTPGSLLSGF